MSVESTLEVILNTVAFKEEDGVNVSILGKAKEDLSEFLSEHTAISDDEKAKRISDFFTNTIMSVTTQAIMVAGQSPLQDAQIINETNESIQKVISMQNDDKAKLNNSAVEVSKAKAEIETLIPAQIQQITSDISHKNAQTLLEGKKLDIADKDILIKEKEVSIKEAEIPLREAQADVEVKRLDVMSKDILAKEAQTDLDKARIPLLSAQIDNERKQIGLTAQQIRVSATEVQYKLAQLRAIQKASEINQKIEAEKNITQIKIANIHALS